MSSAIRFHHKAFLYQEIHFAYPRNENVPSDSQSGPRKMGIREHFQQRIGSRYQLIQYCTYFAIPPSRGLVIEEVERHISASHSRLHKDEGLELGQTMQAVKKHIRQAGYREPGVTLMLGPAMLRDALACNRVAPAEVEPCCLL